MIIRAFRTQSVLGALVFAATASVSAQPGPYAVFTALADQEFLLTNIQYVRDTFVTEEMRTLLTLTQANLAVGTPFAASSTACPSICDGLATDPSKRKTIQSKYSHFHLSNVASSHRYVELR